MTWKSLFSNLMAFSFQNRSVCTELHSRFSLVISRMYLSKELRIRMLLSSTEPMSLMESMRSSSLMLPFKRVSMILRSRLSIINSKHVWFSCTFLKIMKETRVSFSLDNFWSNSQMRRKIPNRGTLMNFSTPSVVKDNNQMLIRV